MWQGTLHSSRGLADVAARVGASAPDAVKQGLAALSTAFSTTSTTTTMSQTHTHGPGTHPGHTHGPPAPQPPQMAVRAPDPIMQAIIAASHRPVDFVLGPPDDNSVLCVPHKLEKCADCDVDYVGMNRLARTLHQNTNLRCPPPPQLVNKPLSQAVTNTKEEGNVSLLSRI